MMSQNKVSLDLAIFPDLKSYFYDGLREVNNKSLSPLPESALLYSSDVLEKVALTQDLYQVEGTKVTDKILGLSILQADQLGLEQKRKIYKEVGDTALVFVGYFSKSLQSKLVDSKYYIEIGKMAYKRMDKVYPDYLDIPGFYHKLSHYFESMATLLKVFADSRREDPFKHLLLEELSDKELLMQGVLPSTATKVS